VSDLDPDQDDGFKNGVHGLFDEKDKPRAPNAWGTIAAWAWGESRVMDYVQTDLGIDSNRIGVVGHSRGGKAALWAGAQDERFAFVASNNSGSTGAALARGKQGETIPKINQQFPHWFSENYKRFNDRERELPVDQHMLAALIAPRLLYIASATEDTWSDPAAEFRSAVEAGTVYKLFGLTGVQTSVIPSPEIPLHDGHIGYHLRTGKHNLTPCDWHCFMDFADKYFTKPSQNKDFRR
jgi:dienelactone hydrolase